jgi:hypothetical protein
MSLNVPAAVLLPSFPQACKFRDEYAKFQDAGAQVRSLGNQPAVAAWEISISALLHLIRPRLIALRNPKDVQSAL